MEQMILVLRRLVLLVLLFGTGASAYADRAGEDPSVEVAGGESAASGILCCHNKSNHNACRLPGSHSRLATLVPKEPVADPPPVVDLLVSMSSDRQSSVFVLGTGVDRKIPANTKSVYLTTLRLRL